jgi:hypothetical protein
MGVGKTVIAVAIRVAIRVVIRVVIRVAIRVAIRVVIRVVIAAWSVQRCLRKLDFQAVAGSCKQAVASKQLQASSCKHELWTGVRWS